MSHLPINNSNSKNLWQANFWLIIRRIFQVAVLGLFLLGPWFGIWFISGNLSASRILDTIPLTDPLLAVQSFLASGGIMRSETAWGLVIVVIFYLLVGGRVFCSWACPLNMVTDLAHWLRDKFQPQWVATLPRSLRFWVLGMVIALSALLGVIVWEVINPVSIMHREVIFGFGMGWTIILGIFILDLFFSERAWCSHICPVGATYSLLGYFSLLRIRSEKEKCDNCGDCYKKCPEPQVIVPAIRGQDIAILDSQCTNCGRCIDICPQNVFYFGIRK
jgi:ferredoxin-type protein NapH